MEMVGMFLLSVSASSMVQALAVLVPLDILSEEKGLGRNLIVITTKKFEPEILATTLQ